MFKGNNDPTLFSSAALETANMTVLHCREVLERTGMTSEASLLQGVEITDYKVAKVALGILAGMRVKAEALYARDLAVINILSAIPLQELHGRVE